MAELIDRLQSAVGAAYRIERELGGGGMSRVFLAEDVELGRRVVIKVLPPEMAADVNKERFHREIQLAAKLQHPHIVPVLTAGASDDLVYYVMPYIEGESLRAKLSREVQLPVGEAVRILREVADALAYAHRQGIVHRDIKPGNVLFSDGHAVVTDFGVAKAVSAAADGETSLTSLGVALGTPAYMAPEQAAANPQVDHRADIYAVGALAYEMLSGQPPFTGPTAQAVLSAQVMQAPEPVTRYREAVPAALNALVMRCLAKLPADRWQGAEQLEAQLEALATPGEGMTPAGAQPVTPPDHEGRARRAHPVRVAGLFSLAAIGALTIVWVLVRAIGLPDWVVTVAIGLLALGLPVMMLTGHQERQRALARSTGVAVATPASGIRRWLTWRRSLLGGVLAFAGLGAVTAVYTGMRLLGIGPVGTLIGAGALDAQDRLILAEFQNRTADSALGPSVTEALRIDLGQSPVIRLMDAAEITRVLGRMNRAPDPSLDPETALEVAEREGIKAVVVGEIGPVGNGYVLSVRLLGAADGSELLALRENAENDAALLSAIDGLSGRLRERIGESLRTIRAGAGLERVTTSSPEALRKYSQGVRAFDRGEFPRARALLKEAIRIDTAFAMAYRKLGAVYVNTGARLSLRQEAFDKAFLFRRGLTDLERYLAVGGYYQISVYDPERARAAYGNMLELDPENKVALNNLAALLNRVGDQERAEQYALRAARKGMVQGYTIAVTAQVEQGAFDRADSTLRAAEQRFPAHPHPMVFRGRLLVAQGDFARAEKHFRELRTRFEGSGSLAPILDDLAALAQLRGRLAAASEYRTEALAVAERRNLPGNYLVQTVNLARLDVMYRDEVGEAVALVEAALDRYPLDGMHPRDRPYFELADFFARAGRFERAERLLTEFDEVPEASRDPYVRRDFARGTIALNQGRIDDAIRLLQGAKAQVRARFQNLVPLGLHRTAGRWHRCHDCGRFNLAVAYDRAGDADSAIAEYERIVTRGGWDHHLRDGPFLAPAYRRLGALYEQRGESELAVEAYNSFVDLWRDADPELQPVVTDVRGRIARLVGERR